MKRFGEDLIWQNEGEIPWENEGEMTPELFYERLKKIGVVDFVEKFKNETDKETTPDESQRKLEFTDMVQEVAVFMQELKTPRRRSKRLSIKKKMKSSQRKSPGDAEMNTPISSQEVVKKSNRSGQFRSPNCICGEVGLPSRADVISHHQICGAYLRLLGCGHCFCGKEHTKNKCGSRTYMIRKASSLVQKMLTNYSGFFQDHFKLLEQQQLVVSHYDFEKMVDNCLLCGKPVGDGKKHFDGCDKKREVIYHFMMCFVNQRMKEVHSDFEVFSSEWFSDLLVKSGDGKGTEEGVGESPEFGFSGIDSDQRDDDPRLQEGVLDLNCDLSNYN